MDSIAGPWVGGALRVGERSGGGQGGRDGEDREAGQGADDGSVDPDALQVFADLELVLLFGLARIRGGDRGGGAGGNVVTAGCAGPALGLPYADVNMRRGSPFFQRGAAVVLLKLQSRGSLKNRGKVLSGAGCTSFQAVTESCLSEMI